jgi:O-antigen/teichoic acid export membrane protein
MPSSDKKKARRRARAKAMAAPARDTDGGSSNGHFDNDEVTRASATALLRPSARLPDYGDDDGAFGDEQPDPSAPRGAQPQARSAIVEEAFDWQLEPIAPSEAAAGASETRVADAGIEDVPVHSETEAAMRGLFGRDARYLVVLASQSGLAALSIPITTRLLGSGFAVITLSLAVMQLLVAIGVFSLSTAIQRNYKPDDDGRDARRTVTLAIITGAITCIVAFATGPIWAPALSHGSFGPALQYTVIWAGLTAVTYSSMALVRSRNLLRLYALISVIQTFVAEGVSVLLVAFVHRSGSAFIFGEMVTQAVAAAIALGVARPIMLRRRDRDLIVSSLKYSGALVPAAVAGFLLSTCDRFIIRSDLPVWQLARYGAVYNVASIPLLLLGLLDSVWLPRFFAIENLRVRGALLADSRDALFRILIPVILGLGFGIPLFLSVWVPHSYHSAGLVVVVLTISAGAIPTAAAVSANRVLLVAGRTVPVGLGVMLAAILNIASNLVLVPILGIEGSALSTSIAFVSLALIATFFAHRVQRLRHPPLELLALSAVAIAVAFSCTALPVSGAFAVARALLTLGCIATVILLLRQLVAPSSAPLLPGRALKRS